MKKLLKSIALGAAGLLMAGTASAATIEFNLYGASAQFTYWTGVADNYLRATGVDGPGCTASASYLDNLTNNNTAYAIHGLTIGTGCNGGADTIRFRYTSGSSGKGISTIRGGSSPDAGCAAGQAKLADEASIVGSVVTAVKCVPVHLAASDVAGASIVQNSYGDPSGNTDLGFLLGGSSANKTNPATGISTSGLTGYSNNIIVPFGFFVNNSVKVYQCVGGRDDGNLCDPTQETRDCKQGVSGNPGVCTQATLSNISREMAVNIFGGKMSYWSEFGPAFSVTGKTAGTDDFVLACLRTAGSGTHATLDWAVFKNGKWGPTMATQASLPATGNFAPYIGFTKDSPTMMQCIDNNAGAIGYADADQCETPGVSCANTTPLKYNGYPARRYSIRRGLYDFWTKEFLYENPAVTPAGSAQKALITKLVSYSGKAANLNATVLPGKYLYWAAASEVPYSKGSDRDYPVFNGSLGAPPYSVNP